MLNIHYLKVHGSRNDFILIDENELEKQLTYSEKQQLTKMLCNRTNGIGADGILFIKIGGRKDGVMQIFNSDGSEASMCGNGLRCAGRYILEKIGKDEAVIETLKADLKVKKFDADKEDVPFIQVEISPVLFDPKAIPFVTDKEKVINEVLPFLSEELRFTALAVPNPHLVAIVSKEELIGEEQKRIAEMLNQPNPYFPDGVNVTFVYPIKPGEVFVNTYERGVGFTNACGTAMSASSLVVILNGLHQYEMPLTVYNNGGYVHTIVHEQDGREWIDLIGNGTYSFEGIISVDMENACILDEEIIQTFDEEEEQYLQMEEKTKVIIHQEFAADKIGD